MARGYASLHPMTEELLRDIGIPSDAVSQGWGSAVASSGFHEPEGAYAGRRFSSAFDLSWGALTKRLRDKLVAASVAVFPRDWQGNQHHHCVHVGLTDTRGKCCIRSGPRAQILDWITGRTGLVGHGPWEGKWAPTRAEQRAIRGAYEAWAPDVPTRMYLDAEPLTTYAWLEGSGKCRAVTCEVRALCDALGVRILEASPAWLTVRKPDGSTVQVYGGEAFGWYTAGEFLRAPVRTIAEGLGYKVGFGWSDDRSFCKVYLG